MSVVGAPKGMTSGFDEEPPYTPENANRKNGSTNFKQCGWCKYASGCHRHNYCISGRCQLLQSWVRDKDDMRVHWYTQCHIRNYGKSDIAALVRSKQYRIKEHKNLAKIKQEEIKALRDYAKGIENRPPLPDHRRHDHFNVGDQVKVLMEREPKMKNFPKFQWVDGTVVSGYRHHDGCVSYHFHNGKCICGDDSNGTPVYGNEGTLAAGLACKCPGCGMSVPHCIKKSEYDYFAKHPDHWEWWINLVCSKTFNGEKFNPLDFPTPGEEGI